MTGPLASGGEPPTRVGAAVRVRAMRRMTGAVAAGALSWAPGGAVAQAQSTQQAAAPQVRVVVTPGRADASGHIAAFDVRLSLPEREVPAGGAVFTMPHAVVNNETAARTLRIVQATDARGPVTLVARDAADGSARQWISERALQGALQVAYRVPIDNTPSPLGTGPPFGLRTEGGGFSGLGTMFLPTPTDPRPVALAVHFDLDALGAGARARTNHGPGDVALASAGPVSRITQAYFMVGAVHAFPSEPSNAGFAGAWLLPVPFDAPHLMDWTAQLYRWYMRWFQADTGRPYTVFLRFNPVNPGGGVALPNAFVVTHDGERTPVAELRTVLAHEMLHTQVSGIAQWFSEGIATYYQRILPVRAGLLAPDAFLDDLNEHAARYYANALNATPMSEVGPRFWEDTRIRTLPYDRGSFYVAVVNTRSRKASGGQRSIDDVVRALVTRGRAGERNTEETWLDLVRREYGEAARDDLQAMRDGVLMLPDSDAFGSCFRRVTRPFPRFELGFEPRILAERGRVVRGLVPGSAAERAGLRDGDEIVVPTSLDNVGGRPEKTITYQVRRDGRTFPVTYLPRGEMVDVYQWERVPGRPDPECSP